MKTPLAWLNLAHHKTRTLLATAGVVFAVVLIFMQLGFLGAAQRGSALVYDALDFDILIRSKGYLHLAMSRTFPRERLYQAEAVPGVEAARPLYVGMHYWRNPRASEAAEVKRLILMLGVNPTDVPFRDPGLRGQSRLLASPHFVLIDRQSRAEFGPRDGRAFGPGDVGVETEVAGYPVRIVGTFSMGTGFAADGAIVMTDEGLVTAYGGRSIDQVSLGLVKLADGADAKRAAAALGQALPGDVEVLTRPKVLAFESDRWVDQTSLGVIFKMGVAVAMVVGTAIVYQVLASDVNNHLPEYATLKAMGYGDGFLSRTVMQQAVILAVFGFLPGLGVAVLLYRITAHWARLPMGMDLGRVLLVLGLAVLMCAVSGLGALRKVRTADPADLF